MQSHDRPLWVLIILKDPGGSWKATEDREEPLKILDDPRGSLRMLEGHCGSSRVLDDGG